MADQGVKDVAAIPESFPWLPFFLGRACQLPPFQPLPLYVEFMVAAVVVSGPPLWGERGVLIVKTGVSTAAIPYLPHTQLVVNTTDSFMDSSHITASQGRAEAQWPCQMCTGPTVQSNRPPGGLEGS